MGRLDIGEALGEGFRLVGRRPLDAVVWGLVYFIVGVLPMIAVFWWLSGDWVEWVRQMEAHPDFSDPSRFIAGQLRLQAIQPLIFLCGIVGRTLVFAAIFRAVLTPADRGFFYLRLGRTELWLALVLVVQAVCVGLVMLALMLPAVLLWIPTMVAAHQGAFGGWEIPLGVLGMLAAFVVFLWLMVRFSMAAPMTFADRQFRLFESWRLTRGHAVGLFALYLVTAVMVGLVAIAVEAILGVIVIGVMMATGFDPSSLEAVMQSGPQAILAAVAPWAIGVGLVFAVCGGILGALFIAPWARAYAQLARPRAAG